MTKKEKKPQYPNQKLDLSKLIASIQGKISWHRGNPEKALMREVCGKFPFERKKTGGQTSRIAQSDGETCTAAYLALTPTRVHIFFLFSDVAKVFSH